MSEERVDPLPRLEFAEDCEVTEVRGGLQLTRTARARRRRCVLTRSEALLCALSERDVDPRRVLPSEAARAWSAATHRRLRTGLRAFLSPERSRLVFADPAAYASGDGLPEDVDRLVRRDFLPREVVWYVTHRCPRTCNYCHWVDKGRADLEPDHLDLTRYERVVDELWAAGVESLVLTGGEPMLRHDVADLIAGASAQGIETKLFSRFSFSPGAARRLADAGLSELYYSLDATDRATNESLVNNPGVAGDARRSVAALVASGVALTVVPVITRRSCEGLLDLVRWLAALGVARIRPIAYKAVRGSPHNLEFALTEREKALTRDMLQEACRYLEVDESTLDLDQKVAICESGLSTLYLHPGGQVAYCPLQRGGEAGALGVLPADELTEIWSGSRMSAMLAHAGLAPLSGRLLRIVPEDSICELRARRLDIV